MNPEQRTILSSLAFRAFASKFQPPTVKEGFQDVVEQAFKVNLGSNHRLFFIHKRGVTEYADHCFPHSLMAQMQSEKSGDDIGLENIFILPSHGSSSKNCGCVATSYCLMHVLPWHDASYPLIIYCIAFDMKKSILPEWYQENSVVWGTHHSADLFLFSLYLD